MQCMKCGRDISAGQVFCESCLEEMARYPVRPGTPVHLPDRPDAPQPRRRRPRRPPKPEELIARLRSRSTVKTVLLLLLLAALTVSVLINLQLLGLSKIPILPPRQTEPSSTGSTPSPETGEPEMFHVKQSFQTGGTRP